jgi:hypothetical protein
MILFADVLADFHDAEVVEVAPVANNVEVVTQAFIDAYNAIGKKRRQGRQIELCETFGFCWNQVRFGNYIVK